MLAASDRANDAALQTDGKLVLAGTCDNGASFQICTARLQGDARRQPATAAWISMAMAACCRPPMH